MDLSGEVGVEFSPDIELGGVSAGDEVALQVPILSKADREESGMRVGA